MGTKSLSGSTRRRHGASRNQSRADGAALLLKAAVGVISIVFLALIVRSFSSDLFSGYSGSGSLDQGGLEITTRINQRLPGHVGISSSLLLTPESGEAYRRLSGQSSDADTRTGSTESDNNTDNEPQLHGPNWFLAQDPDTYTVQFRSSSDLDDLIQFADLFGNSQQLAIYPFKRSRGTVVYGLSNGLFDSFQSAKASLESLPKSLLVDDPWIRPTGKLQQQINSLRR